MYKYRYNENAYLKDWKKNPYTWFKAILYIEISSIIFYLIRKTNIKANTMTIVYILLGVLGGIFLATPLKIIVLLGVLIFYFKDVIDWTDGVLAREKRQLSITGDVLDSYGALTGLVSLWTGFSLYVANKSFDGIVYISPNITHITSIIFDNIIYLVPLLPAIFAMNIILHTNSRLFNSHIIKEMKNYNKQKNISTKSLKDNESKLKNIAISFNKAFEHRARFVDFICIIILIELFFSIFVSWIILLIFLIWKIIFFIITLFMVAKGGYAEKKVEDVINEI